MSSCIDVNFLSDGRNVPFPPLHFGCHKFWFVHSTEKPNSHITPLTFVSHWTTMRYVMFWSKWIYLFWIYSFWMFFALTHYLVWTYFILIYSNWILSTSCASARKNVAFINTTSQFLGHCCSFCCCAITRNKFLASVCHGYFGCFEWLRWNWTCTIRS